MNTTAEQQQIIRHPIGQHAKVLAVAGSGKTTTLAHRIKHLLDANLASRNQIQVLMFNADARRQFRERLAGIGVPPNRQPPIDTFHSYALRVINQHDNYAAWYGDSGDNHSHIALMKARDQGAREHEIDPDDLDAGDLEQAISLWKGALIPPDHAGYRGSHGPAYIAAYAEFEKLRSRSHSITFDDFVPIAVQLLQSSPELRELHTANLRHIIVDEYQDINLGQQRLIELVAGQHADVVAVGDDDQTIYEWRGARSEYILREFAAVFDNRPHATYRLTRSFRFGYAIAQTAYNVITHNTNRQTKNLIAWQPRQECRISLFAGGDSTMELVNEIITIVTAGHARPDDIRILGRTYAQLNQISVNLLLKEVPFTIIGATPFYNAPECRTLLDYIRLSQRLNAAPQADDVARLLNIANRPNRFLRRAWLENQCDTARRQGMDLQHTLSASGLRNFGTAQLLHALETINHARQDPEHYPDAAALLELADDTAGVTEHYRSQYGASDRFISRAANLDSLKLYAQNVRLPWPAFQENLERLDTTRGLPREQQLKLSTIHRVKGLEFDYVVIPDCSEGLLPVAVNGQQPTFDQRQPDNTPQAAEWLESERRLFYVGATRARKALYLGAPAPPAQAQAGEPTPSRFLEEMRLEHTLPVGRAIADADAAALRHACQAAAGHHIILRPLKDIYAAGLPPELQAVIADISLDDAEKPFAYQLTYSAPQPTLKLKPPEKQAYWEHLLANRPQPAAV